MLPHIRMVDGEYIDLLNTPIDRQINIAKKFGVSAVESCKYCNGFDVVDGLRFPATEQV